MNISKSTQVLFIAMASVYILLAASGGLVPVINPDTPNYLSPWKWPDGIFGTQRTPFLGFLLAPFVENFTLFPTVVLGSFFAVVYYLYCNLLSFGVSERAALALSLPLIVSNSVLRYSREVHAEFPAIILLLLSIGLIFRLQDVDSRNAWRYIAYMFTLGLAYLIRPSFLPFMITMPVLFVTLSYLKTQRWQIGQLSVILLLSIAPFLTVSTIRYHTENDFNTVSFGGFNMTGIASAMLNKEIINKLSEEHRELAHHILEGRDNMGRTGEICPMVIDYDTPSLERSFRRTARSYFDILSNNFDEIIYKVVIYERRHGESWVRFNQRMMSFSMDVILAAPFDYAMWIAGAARSATGTATAHNISFVLALCTLLVIYPYLLFSGRLPILRVSGLDVPVIVLITVLTVLGSGVLPILVAFPIIRYVSTSALFLSSLLFYLVIQLFCESRAVTARLR